MKKAALAETLSSDLNLNESRATMNSAIEQQGVPRKLQTFWGRTAGPQ